MASRKHVWVSLGLLAAFGLLGWYFLLNQKGAESKYPFRFGLDLVGGTEVVYEADTSKVEDVDAAMESLKEVIERRVNVFGVSEPLVQVEKAGVLSGNPTERLIVELPGYEDVEKAKDSLGKTPLLEFKLVENDRLVDTQLTGQYLSRAQVVFDPNTQAPLISLEFNKEGAAIFADVTSKNVGKPLAIFLDGKSIIDTTGDGVVDENDIYAPVIQDAIESGKAQITGQLEANVAREIARNLNYGALPVPIKFIGSQLIGATLGEQALQAGLLAGLIGLIALSVFLVFWYRLPGLISVVALGAYVILSLTVFKLIPVTLTAAGMAGFILSIGMAVDANVLIFERTKEELKKGKSIHDSLHEGFHRAWLSIRDSNIASMITALVLFWLGTSAVKGFALTLGLGVAISMFTAITASRTFLFAVAPPSQQGAESPWKRFLFSNGFHLK